MSHVKKKKLSWSCHVPMSRPKKNCHGPVMSPYHVPMSCPIFFSEFFLNFEEPLKTQRRRVCSYYISESNTCRTPGVWAVEQTLYRTVLPTQTVPPRRAFHRAAGVRRRKHLLDTQEMQMGLLLNVWQQAGRGWCQIIRHSGRSTAMFPTKHCLSCSRSSSRLWELRSPNMLTPRALHRKHRMLRWLQRPLPRRYDQCFFSLCRIFRDVCGVTLASAGTARSAE